MHLLKHEIIEYDIMNEEPAQFKKKSNLNYKQNMIPITLDNNKYRMHKRCRRCRGNIRSELKCRPHENPVHVP